MVVDCEGWSKHWETKEDKRRRLMVVVVMVEVVTQVQGVEGKTQLGASRHRID